MSAAYRRRQSHTVPDLCVGNDAVCCSGNTTRHPTKHTSFVVYWHLQPAAHDHAAIFPVVHRRKPAGRHLAHSAPKDLRICGPADLGQLVPAIEGLCGPIQLAREELREPDRYPAEDALQRAPTDGMA